MYLLRIFRCVESSAFLVICQCLTIHILIKVELFTQPSQFPDLVENPDDTCPIRGRCPAKPLRFYLLSNVPLDRPSHDRFVFTFQLTRPVSCALYTTFSNASPHYSPMLHNAFVALGLDFLDEPFNDLKTRQICAITAKSFIEGECRKPNLSVVHALSVLASFHGSLGDKHSSICTLV